MPKPQPDLEIIKLAADITKSALLNQAQWVGPDRVAQLLETVAHKITDLIYTERQ